MTNRTVQFWGQGYAPTGTDPINITASLDGNVVYTGTIPTLYTTDIGRLPTDQVVLFTCEIPMTLSGTVPVSIVIDSPVNSDVYFEQITVNYVAQTNPVYTLSEIGVLTDPASTQAEKIAIWQAKAVPSLSPAEIAILETGTSVEQDAVLYSHNLRTYVSAGPDEFGQFGVEDPKSNVVVNGVPQVRGAEPTGPYGWEVELSPDIAGDGTYTFDLAVTPGVPV